MKKSVEIILKSTFNDFLAWLVRHTQDVYSKRFDTEEGWIFSIHQPSNTLGNTRLIQMHGYYAMLDKDGNEKRYPQKAMIQFEVMRLNQESIEVQATCAQQKLITYFDNLLDSIARCWPESQIEEALMQSPPGSDTAQTSELVQGIREEQKQKIDESDLAAAPALKGTQHITKPRRPPGPKPGVLTESQKDTVRKYREAREKGMTQKSFCAQEGIERSTLRRWETAMKKSGEL